MSSSFEKQRELEERTIVFSVSIVKTLGHHSSNPTLKPLVIQVIRSSSSIGANYAEAVNGSSRADFKNKLYIAKKEAAETIYWLKVLARLLPEENLFDLSTEATQLYLILQKATHTLRVQDKNEK